MNEIYLNLEKTTSSGISLLLLIYGVSFTVPITGITHDPPFEKYISDSCLNYIPDIFFIFAQIKVQEGVSHET